MESLDDNISLPSKISNLIVIDTTKIIYQDIEGNLINKSRQEQKIIWKQEKLKMPSLASALNSEFLILTSPKSILKFNIKNGDLIKIFDNPIFVRTTFLNLNEDLLIGSSMKGVFAISEDVKWILKPFSKSKISSNEIKSEKENLFISGLGNSSSRDYDNIVCIDQASGKIIWKTELKGKLFSKLNIDNENIYLGIKNVLKTKILCLNKFSGEIIWTKEYNIRNGTNIISKDKNLYFNDEKELISINKNNGDLNFRKKIYPFFKIIDNLNDFLVLKTSKNVLLFDIRTKKSKILDSNFTSGPWVIDNYIYSGHDNYLKIIYSKQNNADL